MNIEEVINQLENLQMHCKDYVDKTDGEDSVWERDVQALDVAIEVMGKEIPRKPKAMFLKVNVNHGNCRICGDYVNTWMKYCDNCGQKLDWEE